MPHKPNFGVKPFMFRDEFEYFLYGAIAFGRGFAFEKFWEGGLSNVELSTFTRTETDHCRRQFALGWKCWMKVNELLYSGLGVKVPREIVLRIVMSQTDLLTVVALCKYQTEMWNPLYHGHQAAEKALKAYLLSKGYNDTQLRAIGHDLKTGLEECCKLDSTFKKYIPLLPYMAWDTQWRYKPFDIPAQTVINMYDGALQLLAQSVELIL